MSTATGKASSDKPEKEKSRLGQVLSIIAGVIGLIASIIGIYTFVASGGPPSFSGNLAVHAVAANFASFLGEHVGQKVSLNVTCDGPEFGACGTPPTSSDTPLDLVVDGDPVRSALWCAQNDGECSGYAVIQLSSRKGPISEPGGAGTLSLTGTWRVQRYQGSEVPGDASGYELFSQS